MLSVLFWIGLLGYALVWGGIKAIGSGKGPGVLESLSPSFVGDLAQSAPSVTPSRENGSRMPRGRPGVGGPTGPVGGKTAEVVRQFGVDVAKAIPGASSVGQFSCRRINGSSDPNDPWSEHAWGHAIDIGGSRAVMDKVARYACRNKGKYGIKIVLYCWKVASCVTTECSRHSNHVHVGWGSPGGTPPCAGGGN